MEKIKGIYVDKEAQAKVMQIHKSLGIVSSATLAKRAGYNWKHELQAMMTEEPQSQPEAPKGKKEDGKD